MLFEYLNRIVEVDEQLIESTQENFDRLGKPLRSLGRLEEAYSRIAGMQGTMSPDISKKALVIMCADNGVVAEGVSQCGNEVTKVVTENFTEGKACVNQFAKVAGVDVYPVNVGVANDIDNDRVIDRCVRKGTGNLYREKAMTKDEAEQGIIAGIEMVRDLTDKGYGIIATGEMGIGNTTTSSAIASVLLDMPVRTVTGKGAGLSPEGVNHKVRVIEEAIGLHQPDNEDGMDMLTKIGGLDIAGMAGVFIGGAIYGVPVVVDGIISSVAANLAVKLDARVRDYMLASHVSKEPAGMPLLEALELNPLLICDMGLGEGTGAVGIMPLLDMIHGVYTNMASFEEARIDTYEKFEV